VLRGTLAISQTTTLDPVRWEIVRPDGMETGIDESLIANYENNVALEPQIWVTQCFNSPLYGSYYLEFLINVSATVQTGYVYSLNVTFMEDHNGSYLDLDYPSSFVIQNLTVASYEYLLKSEGLKAFVALNSENQPKGVFFADTVDWWFFSPYNYTHSMEANVDLVYYNGSTFNRVIQPFILKIGPDNNNDFQHATEITVGNYSGMYVGNNDPVDYFKIQLDKGQDIALHVYGAPRIVNDPEPQLNVYVYDPEQNLFTETTGSGASFSGFSQELEFTSNSTGYWYIKVQGGQNTFGFYAMEVRN
jgi:hypothetical protein